METLQQLHAAIDKTGEEFRQIIANFKSNPPTATMVEAAIAEGEATLKRLKDAAFDALHPSGQAAPPPNPAPTQEAEPPAPEPIPASEPVTEQPASPVAEPPTPETPVGDQGATGNEPPSEPELVTA